MTRVQQRIRVCMHARISGDRDGEKTARSSPSSRIPLWKFQWITWRGDCHEKERWRGISRWHPMDWNGRSTFRDHDFYGRDGGGDGGRRNEFFRGSIVMFLSFYFFPFSFIEFDLQNFNDLPDMR